MGTIQRQGLINTVIVYTGVVLGFLNRIVVQPHYLSKAEIGLSALLISFSSLMSTFLLLGTSSMCVRYFPVFKDPSTKHHGFFGFLLLFPVAGSILGGIVIYFLRDWLIASYAKDSPLFVHYFYWGFPLGVIMTLSIVLNAYSNSHLKTTIPSFRNDIWLRVLLIGSAILFGTGLISFDVFVETIIIGYVSQMVILFVYILMIDKPGLKVDWKFVHSIGFGKIVRYSSLMTLAALSSLSLRFLDNLFIGAYKGEAFVATYAIGVFIAQFVETPLGSLERIAGVKISHAFAINNMEEIREVYYRSVRVLFLFGGFLVVCIVTNIHDFLKLLPQFSDAAGVTIILCVSAMTNMATGVNSPILSTSPKYIWSMIFLLILLVVSVSLNMLLIPRFGIQGAAIATGLSSMLYNLLKFGFIWKHFKMQPYDLRSLKTALIIGVTMALAWFIPVPQNPWLAMLERGTVITLVYGALAWKLNIVPEYHGLLTRCFGKR